MAAPLSPALMQLQKKVQNTVAKSDTQATVNLPISSLDWNPDNEFVFGMEGLEQFSEILKDKFKGAVVVFDKGIVDGERRYEIGSGHRRVESLKLAGKKNVPALVFPMPDDVEKAEYWIDSNILNRPLTPINYARAFAHLKKVYTKENEKLRAEKKPPMNVMEKIASRYGINKRNVIRYIDLNNLIPDLQKLIKDNVVAWTALSEVTKWGEEDQKTLYKLIMKYLKENSETSDDDSDVKTIKVTKTILMPLIAQVGNAIEEKEETPKESVPKRINVNSYFTKVSSQMSKLIDMPLEDIEFPENTVEIKNSIQMLRDTLDKLEIKLNEKA